MKGAIAVIPARGGSKRIPRKNVRDFCGKPMIAWSIGAALESGLFERVIVSTDDPEIREIAIAHGAEIPFDRPEELANDHAGTLPVIRHAVQWLRDSHSPVVNVCCIYATAPFLNAGVLQKAYHLLQSDTDIEFAFTAAPFDFPIFRAIRLDDTQNVSMFWPEHETTRSQDLPAAYHDAGQCYWGTAEAWLTRDLIFSSHCRAVVLPPHLVQDIDTPEDWLQAELKFHALRDHDERRDF